MAMHVIFPGPRTTVQDKGRLGYQNSGFAPGGFIDKVASRMANVLVDNQDDEAVLEFCLIGPILEFDEEVNLAVCGGDFGIDVGGKVYPADKAVHVPAGATVRITTGNAGTYGSLAVAGGLDIPEVMGSRSTNLRCGIGGFEGRALRAGDVIGLRHPEKGQQDLSWRWVPERQLSVPTDSGITKVRVIPGPQEDMFTEEGIRTFYESAYVHGFTPGLQNLFIGPYYKPNAKFACSATYHYMAVATKVSDLNKTLGHCIDLQASYQFSKDIALSAGYTQMMGTETMKRLKQDDSSQQARWGWFSLIISPSLFTTKW